MVSFSSKTKKLVRLGLKILGLVIIIGTLGWFLIVNPLLIRQEKARFETAAQELEKLSQHIQTNGEAASANTTRACGYASAKFTRGPRSCGVYLELPYPEVDLSRANQIMEYVRPIIGSRLYADAGNRQQTKFESNDDYLQSFSQEFYRAGLLCHVRYKYTDTTKLKDNSNNKTLGLVIRLQCGGPARAEHYPVE